MIEKDELFYACTNYIEAFNHFKSSLYEVEHKYMHSHERKKIMNFEKERIDSAILILEKVVGEKIKNDKI